MTRNEAINDLKVLKEYFEQESGAFPVCIEYAIDALKLESDESQALESEEGAE